MRVCYPDYYFRISDFMGTTEIKRPICADVIAFVRPDEYGGLDVEVLSVKWDGRELVNDLKSDAEWTMAPIMRSFYLAEARKGIEGDVGA